MNNCVHHWHIEAPAGPTSAGVCLRCGARHSFMNSDEFSVPFQSAKKRCLGCREVYPNTLEYFPRISGRLYLRVRLGARCHACRREHAKRRRAIASKAAAA